MNIFNAIHASKFQWWLKQIANFICVNTCAVFVGVFYLTKLRIYLFRMKKRNSGSSNSCRNIWNAARNESVECTRKQVFEGCRIAPVIFMFIIRCVCRSQCVCYEGFVLMWPFNGYVKKNSTWKIQKKRSKVKHRKKWWKREEEEEEKKATERNI